MSHINFLSPENLKLWQLEDGTLILKHECRKTLLAPPRRALPLTYPNEFIIFSDTEGSEIGVLRNVDDLEPASRTVLQESLAREYVLERISRILEVDREPLTGQTRWRVELVSDEPIEPIKEILSESEAASSLTGSAASSSTTPSIGNTDDEKIEAKEEVAVTPLNKVASFLSLSRDKEKSEEIHSGREREFYINGQEDIQTARYPHIFIVDTERHRYEILNCEALDLESRRAAERFF